MLQRLQTLFLFIVTLLCVLLIAFQLNFAHFSTAGGSAVHLGFWKNVSPDGANLVYNAKWINLFLLVGIGITSFATIFLFKDRKLQLKLCLYLTLGCLALYFLLWMDYSFISTQEKITEKGLSLHVIWPGIMALLSLLSWWGVRKDDKLVTDMDRLR